MTRKKDIIADKIKEILLEIKLNINFEKKFDIYEFESNLVKYETGIEKNKTIIQFLMEILEKIFQCLMREDKLYKNNPKLKYLYRKIKTNQENEKFKRIRIIQINKLKKKEEEKSKKIIENYSKIRFLSLNRKGLSDYRNFKKELKDNSFNETFSANPFFSFSFDEKNKEDNKNNNNNNKYIWKKKKGIRLRDKKEEILNLLLY